MGQEIKIQVEAKVGGAVKAADALADAFDGVGAAVNSIDASSKKAAAGLDRLLDRLEEIQRVQGLAETRHRPLGIGLSEADAGIFLGRWDSMRSARGPGTARVRQFDSFSDWFHGHEGLYNSPREAAAHRKRMIETALQGTEYRRSNGPTFESGGGGGGDSGGSGGGGGGGAWGVRS